MLGTGPLGVTVRVIVGIWCLCIAGWGVLPTFTGRFHSGCLTMILLGVLGVAVCVAFPQVTMGCGRAWQSAAGRTALVGIGALIVALVLLFVVVSGCMVAACNKRPQEGSTLIVLGAALRGDQPSRLLRGRLEAAYAYLIDHPQAVCIVSGGQGEDEICTEASVMKTYLVNRGIDASRIYEEDSSTSTFENIRHSREIIEQHELSKNVTIVTQEFHQFRAQQFVERAGLTVAGAITAHSPWHLLPSYWIRDFAGICHMIVFGT